MSGSDEQSQQENATTDLRTELKRKLLAHFDSLLAESETVSDEQREQLCWVVEQETVASSQLVDVITRTDQES